MRYISEADLLRIHELVINVYGGLSGVRDRGSLRSALAQPLATFAGEDLYPSIFDKASALGFSLIRNHPFLDGNKRTGLTAMGLFLELNGYSLEASNDEAEHFTVQIAKGEAEREEIAAWQGKHAQDVSK